MVGRLCCDSDGKLNAKSVILEGSRETSGGRHIQLDLSAIERYSLFPGQVGNLFWIMLLVFSGHFLYLMGSCDTYR